MPGQKLWLEQRKQRRGMTVNQIALNIDDIASDFSRHMRALDELCRDGDPVKAAKAEAIRNNLSEAYVSLLHLKAEFGSCQVDIPIVDEEIELLWASEWLERMKKAIPRKEDGDRDITPAVNALPLLSDGDVEDLGLF